MPRPAKARLPVTSPEGAEAIYFPACISRMMGHLPGEPEEMSLVEALVKVSARAGVPVHIPHDVEGTCCGVPFSSKGFDLAHRFTVNRAVEKFWAWTDCDGHPENVLTRDEMLDNVMLYWATASATSSARLGTS